MTNDYSMRDTPPTVLAIAAHPDDVEFVMMGTLLLLKQAGAEIHIWNLANGCMGSGTHSYREIIDLRWEEAQTSASEAGAVLHPPIVDDLAIFYNADLIARVAAVVRMVKPAIILTHSPQDYMEDHMNASRLAVTGAFARGMTNFATIPPVEPWGGETVIYHAMPHGLRGPLRQRIRAGQYVDVSGLITRKRTLLAHHRTQKDWLALTHGGNMYLDMMEAMNRQLGAMSGQFDFAEGWRRHLHIGFAPDGFDPMAELLGDACWVDESYESLLDG